MSLRHTYLRMGLGAAVGIGVSEALYWFTSTPLCAILGIQTVAAILAMHLLDRRLEREQR